MSIRHQLSVVLLAIATACAAVPAMAYEYTGKVKTLESGGWLYWQEIILEAGDDSVWTPCRSFTRQLRDLTARPITFSVEECVDLAEVLSGVANKDDESLPIGTALWVPYVPINTPATVVEVAVFPAAYTEELNQLKEDLAATKAAQLTEADVVAIVAREAEALKDSLQDQFDQLREELLNEQKAGNNAQKLRFQVVEQAFLEGRPVPKAVVEFKGPSQADFAELAEQVNDLAGLQSLLTEMEERLTKKLEDGLATKADTKTVADLSGRVQALEDEPKVVTGPNWFWFWLLAPLSIAAIVLSGLVAWLFSRTNKTKNTVKDHAERITTVEETLGLVVTYNAQKRFACPELTDQVLNDLPVGGKPIRLTIKEIGTGAVHPTVDIQKGENAAGDPYLVLVGTKNAKSEQVNPKTIKGKQTFKVAQVFKQLDTVIQKDEVVGVVKGRELL